MITAWRIVKKKHSASAFDGEGARRYGGRWNSLGTAMVYTADYLATAALELMVNMIDYSDMFQQFRCKRRQNHSRWPALQCSAKRRIYVG